MPPMKNIYNLITDAFDAMDNRENRETDYTIDIQYAEPGVRTYTIHIVSKNQNAIGSATVNLILDNSGNLLDYEDTNDLFINSNWDRFCLVIEGQLSIQDIHSTLQQYILAYANGDPDTADEDEYET